MKTARVLKQCLQEYSGKGQWAASAGSAGIKMPGGVTMVTTKWTRLETLMTDNKSIPFSGEI